MRNGRKFSGVEVGFLVIGKNEVEGVYYSDFRVFKFGVSFILVFC